jgi:hypothetical protein
MEITARPSDSGTAAQTTRSVTTRVDDRTYEALIAEHDRLNFQIAAQGAGQDVYVFSALVGFSTGVVLVDRLLGGVVLASLPNKAHQVERRDALRLQLRLIESARFEFAALAEEDGPASLEMPPMWRRDP